MKKQLLLLAGGLLALASCNTAPEGGASDAQIDSMVNTRVEELRMEMMRQNDSLINAMAQIKADSIIAAMKGGSTVTTKTTTTRTTKVTGKTPEVKDQPAAEAPPQPGGIRQHSDQNKQNQGGIRQHSDQNKQQKQGGLRQHSDQNKQN